MNGTDAKTSVSSTSSRESKSSKTPTESKDADNPRDRAHRSIPKLLAKLSGTPSCDKPSPQCPFDGPPVDTVIVAGPSDQAASCKTVQDITDCREIGTSCAYWKLHSQLSDLMHRNFRRDEEIECLSRGIGWCPGLPNADGGLAEAQFALYAELKRLYNCIERKHDTIDAMMDSKIVERTRAIFGRLENLIVEVEAMSGIERRL